MPDIILPHTFATGDVASADKVAENLHSPNAVTPDSLDVINGLLDRDNTLGPGTWTPGADQFQFGSLSRVESVSGTTDQQWVGDAFPNDPGNLSIIRRTKAIPGACRDFYAHYAGTLLRISWTVFHRTADTAANPTVYFLKKAPSDADFISIASHFRTIPVSGTTNTNDCVGWSGSFLISATETGLWRFMLAIVRIRDTSVSFVASGYRSLHVRQVR